MRKSLFVDSTRVEAILDSSATGTDILSVTTRAILETITLHEVDTAELFRAVLDTGLADRPKRIPYLATACAYAIKVHKKHNVEVTELVQVIFEVLDLPWIITTAGSVLVH